MLSSASSDLICFFAGVNKLYFLSIPNMFLIAFNFLFCPAFGEISDISNIYNKF
jgi:hypothetical protein